MEFAKNLLIIRRVEFLVVELTIFSIPILFVINGYEEILSFTVLEGFVLFFLLHSLGYMINCWADRDLDKSYKTRFSKAVSALGVNRVRNILIADIVLCLGIGVHLSWVTGKWLLLLLVLAGIFLGVQYSTGPIHFKSRGTGQLVCLWHLMYFLPMIYSGYLVKEALTWGLLFVAASYATVEMGIILVSTSEDLPEDRGRNIVTTTVALGLQRTLHLALGMVLIGGLAFLGVWMAALSGTGFTGWSILVQALLGLCLVYIVTQIFQLIRRVKAAESEDGAIELVRSRGKMVPLWATLIGWAGVLCGVVHLASQEV